MHCCIRITLLTLVLAMRYLHMYQDGYKETGNVCTKLDATFNSQLRQHDEQQLEIQDGLHAGYVQRDELHFLRQ